MSTSVDVMEQLVEDTGKWGADYVKNMIELLAPDGRPFGTEKKSEDEMLEEYRTIRNDVEAWKLWIGNKASIITNMLSGSGVNPEYLTVINPMKIASQFALDYSIKMEALLEERMVT